MAKLSERIEEQQARRTRRPLPPSHPRQVRVDTAPGELETAGDQTTNVTKVTEDADLKATDATDAQTSAGAKPRGTKQEQPIVPLEPRQVWLDQQNDLWLSECEYANVRRGGRKVISRSAVVRLALDQLRERMTAEQITDLLADREPTQHGRGRPRR